MNSKFKIKRILLVLLVLGLVTIPVYAKTTSEKIDEIEQKRDETLSDLEDAQGEITGLEDSMGNLEGELGKLESNLKKIVDNLQKLEEEIKNTEADIEQTKIELEAAKKKEAEQYQAMKTRIKFMYERNDSSFFELMLSSESMSDALNKAEYFSKITEYDRDMLQKYQETRESIAAREIELKEKEESLLATQSEVKQEQEKVAAVIKSTSSEIENYKNQISAAEQRALEYEQQLIAQENSLEYLKQVEAEEKAAAERAAAENATTNTSGLPLGNPPQAAYDASQLELLAAIIECEAAGESNEGKIAVGNVVLNRMASNRYPSAMVDVLFQRHQFTPVTSGRFMLVLARGANSTCTAAAQSVLNGAVVVGPEILHFRVVNPYTQGIVIGNHVFY